MDHPLTIARRIKGLTQADLARESGMCRSTISKIEKGQRGSISSYKRIALALGSDYRLLLPSEEK